MCHGSRGKVPISYYGYDINSVYFYTAVGMVLYVVCVVG